jgi:hypothetical protein
MARLKIFAMANDRTQSRFFLTGMVMSGDVHTGMVAHLPQPPVVRLSSIVETVESAENTPEQVVLGFHYDSDDQLYAWRNMNLLNHEIELSEWISPIP